MDYLAFVVDGDSFAVSLDRVREISPLGQVTRVPGAPPAFRGVFSLRGAPVPIVDVAMVLGRRPSRISRRTVAIQASALVESAPTPVGLLVDAVERLLSLAPGEVLPVPAGLRSPGVDVVVGFGNRGGRLVPILDVDGVVALARVIYGERASAVPATPTPEEDVPPDRPVLRPEAATSLTTSMETRSSPALPKTRKPSAPARFARPATVPTATACRSPAPRPPERCAPGERDQPGALPARIATEATSGFTVPRTRPASKQSRSPWAIAAVVAVALVLAVMGWGGEIDRDASAVESDRPRSAVRGGEKRASSTLDRPTPTARALPPAPLPARTPEVERDEASLPPHGRPLVHEVRPGDTLWALGRRYYGDPFRWPKIYADNRERISTPDLLIPGMRLAIPR